jgi:hypothetical protein
MNKGAAETGRREAPFWILAVVLVLGAIGVGWWLASPYLYFGADPPPTDYGRAYNDLALRASGIESGGQNQWLQYLALIDAVIGAEESLSGQPVHRPDGTIVWGIDATGVLDRNLSPGDETQAVLDGIEHYRREGVFDLLDALGPAPRAARPVDGYLLEGLKTDMGVARQLARIEFVRLAAAYRAGNAEEVGAAARQSVALGSVLTPQPCFIERLTGNAILGSLCTRIGEEVAAHPPTPDVAGALINSLSGVQFPPLSAMVEGERLVALDALNRALPAQSIIRAASRGAQMAKVDELYIPLRDSIDAATPARNAAAAEFDAALDALPKTYTVVAMLAPMVKGLIQSDDQMRTSLNGTITMLAIEIFAASHGGPPATLADLVPSVLPELPLDPHSNAPFRYRLFGPGEDPIGRRYLLYAVGPDGADNGGHTDPENPFRAFSATKGDGFDFVLNAPKGSGD